MTGTARRFSIYLGVLAVLVASAGPALAQVTPGTPQKVSSPNATSSTRPSIAFHPITGLYGISYREQFNHRYVGSFFDQDGNRTAGPFHLLSDNPVYGDPLPKGIVPFSTSTAMLSTFEVYGENVFGNNVFIGDAGGVAFVNNGLTSGLINYTNNGNDKFVATNCGEHEEAYGTTVDTITGKFFLAYSQSFHFYQSPFCKTSGSMLMAAYHQNGLPFGFSNGPFSIQSDAFAMDQVFNPATGHVWLGYVPPVTGRMSVALLTPSGVAGSFMITQGGDGITRGGLKFAVHPVTHNVLAVWQETVGSLATIKARLFTQNGAALTPDITLSNPATENIQRVWVGATADNFFVAGAVFQHVLGRVLNPQGQPASAWTRLDFLTDQFGNPMNVNFGIDLATNPVRGTYALVVDTFSDSYFIEITATAGVPLTVNVNGTGTGQVTSNPPGINCPGTCSMSVPPGTDVELTATAANFSDFTGWGGACSGSGSCIVTLNTPATVDAAFTHQQFPIRVSTIGQGTVTSSPNGIDCGAICSQDFDAGSTVTLHALAGQGWRFDHWSGACVGSGPCEVQVLAAESVTATFVQQFTLTLSTSGSGGGSIASNAPGISCVGQSCAFTVDAGAAIQLSAAADATSRFGSWSGGCTGSGACDVVVNSDTGVDASFIRQFDVEVSIVGPGSVSSNPAGIACPGDCTERFDVGTAVTLTAPSIPGYRFAGWSGDPECSGMTCTMSPAAYKLAAVTATYVEQFTLSVSLAGNGAPNGGVFIDGVPCVGDCTKTFDANSVVIITQTLLDPNIGIFAGWSGDCSGSGFCVVTMTGARSVTANFFYRQFTLTVIVPTGNGLGGGTVTGPGISCPGDCSETFTYFDQVQLVATPDSSSFFNGWGGVGCAPIGPCNVSILGETSLMASFLPIPTYPLSVATAGQGGGSVTSNPPGINCGAACVAQFDAGSPVTLTATPNATSTFAGWSGACSGTGACVVTMNAAQAVTATFDAVTLASVSTNVAALAPVIGAGSVNSVNGKLSNAQASMARGNKNAAANQVNAAINEIQALVRSGRLSAAAGATLIAQLNAILIGL